MNKRAMIIIMALSATVTAVSAGSNALVVSKEIRELESTNRDKDSKIEEMMNKAQAAQDEINVGKEKEEALRLEIEETQAQLEDARQDIARHSAKVTYSSWDVSVPSNAEVSHMQRALTGTNIYDVAEALVTAEREYGVNAFFLASIAAHESSWGNSPRAIYDNNLTGYAVYNSLSRGAVNSSRDRSIYNTAELLSNDYLTPGADHFNGFSAREVNMKYCFHEDMETIDFNWSDSINSIASGLIEKANNF